MDNTWLWLVGGLVIALVGASTVLRRVRLNNAQLFAKEATTERAAEASARLSEPQHRLVNSHLAVGNLLAAAQEIRNATGQPARAALLDAQAMRLHPQPWKPAGLWDEPHATGAQADPLPGSELSPSGEPGSNSRTGAAADPVGGPSPEDASSVTDHRPAAHHQPAEGALPAEDTLPARGARSAEEAQAAQVPAAGSDAEAEQDWTIPDSWETVYGGDAGRGERHMEFTHHDGEELYRFSTQDLPDSERDQLMSQLRDGDMGSAADLIASRVGLDRDEVENALRSNHESGNDRLDGIAVRFDRGDGTTVEFSTQDLPEEERRSFVEALKTGDLVTAAQVVSRHTGISEEQALSLLHAFRRRG